AADSAIVVTLDQLHGGGHLIGRFRLEATTAPIPEISEPIPLEIGSILAVAEAKRTPVEKAELARWLWRRRLGREQAYLPAPAVVYGGTKLFKPDGSFKPTESPRVIHLLKRGEVTKPQQSVPPGSLRAVSALKSTFPCSKDDVEGKRRAALAAWLVDRN